MKTRLPFYGWGAAILASAGLCLAQATPPAAPDQKTAPLQPVTPIPPVNWPASAAQPEPVAALSDDQLDDLTGPIALYPDPLIAQILPASTYPIDIVMAARMAARKATPEEIDAQEWDPSVKAIAKYPSIIKMMDERLTWTTQLGAAFARQPDQVMDSVQRLRVKARTLGHLKDTPQQKVIVDDDEPDETVVRIVPASPQVVYVPSYEPSVVYYQPYTVSYVPSPYIWFGAGFAIGAWLNLDCDWYRGGCYYPVGWSWSNCYFPSWRWHGGWGGWGYSYWCGRSYYGHGYYGHGYYGHRYHEHHHHGHHDHWGRTDDSHFASSRHRTNDFRASTDRSWARNDSRALAPLRTRDITNSSLTRGNVPGHRRTIDRSPGLVSGDRRSVDRIADPRRVDANPGSRDSLRRTMTPGQIQDRLSRSSPRADASPRATDRVVPGNRRSDTPAPRQIDASPRQSDRVVPGNRRSDSPPRVDRVAPQNPRGADVGNDSLRRTRQLTPPASGGRVINRGNTGLVVPGSGDVRSRGPTSVRTISPGRSGPAARPSSSPGRVSPPARTSSPGRQGFSRPSSSPSRSVAPSRSASPSRSAAPASRGGGSAPGNRRSR